MLLVSCLACASGNTQTIKTMKAMTLMLNNIDVRRRVGFEVGGAALRQNRETKKVPKGLTARCLQVIPIHSLDWL